MTDSSLEKWLHLCRGRTGWCPTRARSTTLTTAWFSAFIHTNDGFFPWKWWVFPWKWWVFVTGSDTWCCSRRVTRSRHSLRLWTTSLRYVPPASRCATPTSARFGGYFFTLFFVLFYAVFVLFYAVFILFYAVFVLFLYCFNTVLCCFCTVLCCFTTVLYAVLLKIWWICRRGPVSDRGWWCWTRLVSSLWCVC